MDNSLENVHVLNVTDAVARPVHEPLLASTRAARLVLLAFLPLTLLLFLPPPWLILGFIVVPAYIGTCWLLVSTPLPRLRANLFMLLLLTAALIGLFTTPTLRDGAISIAKVLAGVMAFYILTDFINTPSQRSLVAAGLVTLGFGLTVLIPFAVEWSLNKVYPIPFLVGAKPPASGINPNIVAAVLALCVPLAVSLLASKPWRIVGAVALLPLLGGLIVLQSRGAWFALGGGFLLSATAYRRWLFPLLLLLFLGGIGANTLLGGPSLAPYVLGRVGTATSGTSIERQALWAQAIQLIQQHPIAGIGMGAYPTVAPYLPPYSPAKPGLLAAHAHNLYLQVALDTGIPGLIGFTALFVAALMAAWRAFARNRSALALGVLAALGVVAVNGLVDSVFWGLKADVTLFVLYALAFSFEEHEVGRASLKSGLSGAAPAYD